MPDPIIPVEINVPAINQVVEVDGKQVRVRSDAQTLSVPVTLIGLPVNIVPCTIELIGSDLPKPGGSVKVATPGLWDDNPILTYQAVADEVPISGATNPLAFTFTTAQVGKTFQFLEIPDGDLSKAKLSSNGILVLPNAPVNETAPVVSPSPTAVVGTEMACDGGTWTNNPDSVLIQWQLNENDWFGVTGPTADTTGLVAGTTIRTKCEAANAGGTSQQVFSNSVTLTEPPEE